MLYCISDDASFTGGEGVCILLFRSYRQSTEWSNEVENIVQNVSGIQDEIIMLNGLDYLACHKPS